MPTILKTPEGKKVSINMPSDICLYRSPENPPNTGSSYLRGSDLYAHKARSGNVYFYINHWSMWQGEERKTELISKGYAEKFLLDLASVTGWGEITDSEWERIREFFPNLEEENA